MNLALVVVAKVSNRVVVKQCSSSVSRQTVVARFRCGIRGGYREVVGLDEDVKYQLAKLGSARLCSNSLGQVRKYLRFRGIIFPLRICEHAKLFVSR